MRKKVVPVALSFLLFAVNCQNKEKSSGEKLQEHEEMAMQKVREYERVLGVNPKDLEVLIALGNISFDMGKWEKAVESYLKALAIDSTNVDVRTDMGTAYKNMGLYDLAEREFKKGIAINPKHAKAYYNLGVVYYDLGRHKETLALWEKNYELETDPQFKEIARRNIEQLKYSLGESTALTRPAAK